MIRSFIVTIVLLSSFDYALASPLSSLSFSGIEKKNTSSLTNILVDEHTHTSQSVNHKTIKDIVAYGKTFIGTPYVYGGTSPRGFDCSGFVQYVYKQAGITLPRTSRAQYQALTKVDEPEIGDLVFFSHGKRVNHVGIYVGHHKMLHAPSSGKLVQISSLDNSYWQKRYIGARRIVDAQLTRDTVQILAQNSTLHKEGQAAKNIQQISLQ